MNDTPNTQPLKQRLRGVNLHLVGMMGSGKSSTGRPLAAQIGYGFVDADAVIEQLAGRSISQIFSEEGEESFRAMESQVLNAIGQRHSLVVATGGGVVTQAKNWGVLHQGIVIWLDPGRDRLLQRLQADADKRPLLQTPKPEIAFDALLEARQPLYAEADLHLSVGEESPQQVAERIVGALPGLIKNPEDPNAPRTTAE